MNISLELYRIFNAAARTSSFTAAARELYITQSAVSQSVRQLESAMGVKLFVRGARGISLTREGETLQGYTSSALNLLEAGEKRVAELSRLSGGELRIGAGDTVSKWFLLPVIEQFHRLYPAVALHITNRTSGETLELMKNGQLDLGFVNMPISASGVLFEECLPVHDVFVCGEKYKDLASRPLPLEELAGYPLIMLERSANSRRWVDRHFFSHGVELRAEIELGAHDLLADYARIGLGIACVVDEFVQRDGLYTLTLDEEIPARSIGACYLEEIGPSPAARRFIDMARSRGV